MLSDLGTLSHTLPNGNKIYSLPQDNMPCVVPLDIGHMPVVSPPVRGAMPNPAVPLLKKPLNLSTEQLLKLGKLKMELKKNQSIHR
jgi:hypothetical protein